MKYALIRFGSFHFCSWVTREWCLRQVRELPRQTGHTYICISEPTFNSDLFKELTSK